MGTDDFIDNIRVAPLYKRLLSFVFDVLLIYSLSLVLLFIYYWLKGINIYYAMREWHSVHVVLFGWVYFVFSNLVFKGRTAGDILFDIRTVSKDGKKLKLWQIIGRSIAISSFLFIFQTTIRMMLAQAQLLLFTIISLSTHPFKKYRQTIWDVVTKTCVIDEKMKQKSNR